MRKDLVDFVSKAAQCERAAGTYNGLKDTYFPKKLLTRFALRLAIWAIGYLTKRLNKELEK